MANLTIKNNSYEPITLRQQQSKVGYNGAQIVDQSGFYGQMSKTAGTALKVIQDREESDEALRVASASNSVAKRLAELKVDIAKNKQGSNATDSQLFFEQRAAQIEKEEYAKSGIKYKAGENMFKKAAMDNIVSGSVWAYKWQAEQDNEVRVTTFDQYAQDRISDVLSGGSFIENYVLTTEEAKSMFAHSPVEKQEELARNIADQFASVLVVDHVNNKQFDKASLILEQIGNKMTPTQKVKLEALVANSTKIYSVYDSAHAIMKNARRPDGSIDYAKAIEMADNQYGYNSSGEMPSGSFQFNPGVSFEGAQAVTSKGVNALSGLLSQKAGLGEMIITSVNDSHDIHVGSGGPHTHAGGYKADGVIPGFENLSTAEQYALIAEWETAMPGLKIKNEYAERSPGWTGPHLDLDFTNYKGGSGRRFDPEQQAAIKAVIYNEQQQESRIRGFKAEGYNKNLIELVMNGTPTVTQLDQLAQEIYMDDPLVYNELAPAISKLKSLGAPGRVGSAKTSDPATLAMVYQEVNNGTLTVADLTTKYGGLLSMSDYKQMLKQITLKTSPAVKAANKEIINRINAMFSDEIDRIDVQNFVFENIDKIPESMNPDVRAAAADKLMREKADILAKSRIYREDRVAAGNLIAASVPYGLSNEVATIMEMRSNNSSIAAEIADVLSVMIEGDIVQQEAFQMLVGNSQSVNRTTMNNAITAICEKRKKPLEKHLLKENEVPPTSDSSDYWDGRYEKERDF